MAALTVQSASLAGTAVSLAAAGASGDTFTNDGNTVLVVDNASGASIDVTVDSPTLCNQGEAHDVVVSVGAGAQKMIGPFPVDRFSTTVSVTYSATTSVTVAARKVA